MSLRQTLSGLVIPSHAQIHDIPPKYVCRVPAEDGLLCGKPFWEGEERAFEKHVVACAQENAGAIERYRAKRAPISGEKSDLEQWVDENKDLLIEGRKKL